MNWGLPCPAMPCPPLPCPALQPCPALPALLRPAPLHAFKVETEREYAARLRLQGGLPDQLLGHGDPQAKAKPCVLCLLHCTCRTGYTAPLATQCLLYLLYVLYLLHLLCLLTIHPTPKPRPPPRRPRKSTLTG